jgi:hypothetical protein
MPPGALSQDKSPSEKRHPGLGIACVTAGGALGYFAPRVFSSSAKPALSEGGSLPIEAEHLPQQPEKPESSDHFAKAGDAPSPSGQKTSPEAEKVSGKPAGTPVGKSGQVAQKAANSSVLTGKASAESSRIKPVANQVGASLKTLTFAAGRYTKQGAGALASGTAEAFHDMFAEMGKATASVLKYYGPRITTASATGYGAYRFASSETGSTIIRNGATTAANLASKHATTAAESASRVIRENGAPFVNAGLKVVPSLTNHATRIGWGLTKAFWAHPVENSRLALGTGIIGMGAYVTYKVGSGVMGIFKQAEKNAIKRVGNKIIAEK